jgi:hypothetical protein
MTARDRPAMIPNGDAVLALTVPVAVYPALKPLKNESPATNQ